MSLPLDTATAHFLIHTYTQGTETQPSSVSPEPSSIPAMRGGGIKILDKLAQYQYENSRAPRKRLGDTLDRLRSKKGFPTGDDLDLDFFLYPNNNNPVDARPDNPTRTRSAVTNEEDVSETRTSEKSTTSQCGSSKVQHVVHQNSVDPDNPTLTRSPDDDVANEEDINEIQTSKDNEINLTGKKPVN